MEKVRIRKSTKEIRWPKHTFVTLLVIIILYRAATFLSQNWSGMPLLHFANLLFSGIYSFVDGLWLIGTIVCSYFAITRFSDSVDGKERLWNIGTVLLWNGIYDFEVFKRHFLSFVSGTDWVSQEIVNVASSDMPTVAAFFTLLIFFCFGLLKAIRYFQKRRGKDFATGETCKNTYNVIETVETESTAHDHSVNAGGDRTSPYEAPQKAKEEGGYTSQGENGSWLFPVVMTVILFPIMYLLTYSTVQEISSNVLGGIESLDSFSQFILPFAPACVAIFFALAIAFLLRPVLDFFKGLSSQKWHQELIVAVILELVLLIVVPNCEETIGNLLNTLADGNIVLLILILLVLLITIWFLLIVIRVGPPSNEKEQEDSIENKVKFHATKIFHDLLEIALELVKSGIQIIRIATVDFIKAIIDLLDLKDVK